MILPSEMHVGARAILVKQAKHIRVLRGRIQGTGALLKHLQKPFEPALHHLVRNVWEACKAAFDTLSIK